jgi:peptidoglycan/LPS O-acetylase OafA/YrhL
VAASFVVMHHVWQFSTNGATEQAPGWFRSLTLFKFGPYAVAVFIVVSGYCLTLPTLRVGTTWVARDRRRFAFRRARRILPPYLAALFGSMALVALDRHVRAADPGPGFTSGNVLSHLGLVHNWSRSWMWAFNGPLWSTALEVQIYVVFALLLLPMWRRFGAAATFGVAIAITVIGLLANASYVTPWMVILFVVGMLAAAVGSSPHAASPGAWRVTTSVLVVAVVIATAMRARLSNEMVADLVVGAATGAGLIAMSRVSLHGGSVGLLQRLLSSRPARTLGVVSFSLYLVHFPILAVIAFHWAGRFDPGSAGLFAILCLLGVPAILLVTVAFHMLIERPFQNHPVKATAWRSGPSEPQVAAGSGGRA